MKDSKRTMSVFYFQRLSSSTCLLVMFHVMHFPHSPSSCFQRNIDEIIQRLPVLMSFIHSGEDGATAAVSDNVKVGVPNLLCLLRSRSPVS